MREPLIQLSDHRDRVWSWANLCIVTLEGLYERLGHAIRLRALDRCGQRHQTNQPGQCPCVGCCIGRAVVRQPLDRRWKSIHQAEAAFDAFHHQIADVAAVNAACGGHPGDRLAVTAVEGKNDAHPLAIIATDLEPIRAPADVGPINRDATVMAPFNPGTGMAL